MKIWIDGYEANVRQRLGSSQVAFELLKALERLDKKNEYTILLPSPPLDDLPKERVGWKYKILRPKIFWTKIALPLALFSTKEKPDIIFSPTHYIPRFCPQEIKRIVTIFDLSFLHFEEMFTKKDLWKLKNWTKFSIENADHIVTISNFSKQDIIDQYKLDKSKITVAYPGFNKEKFKIQGLKPETSDVLKKYGIEDPYIIYIGTIQPRKNIPRLIEAFARVAKDTKVQLVIVGKTRGEGRQGWMFEDILKIPRDLGIEEKVKFLGYVPVEDLILLLSGANVFINPSLWEGFGMPVVEAMASGVPVIVSNVSSLPEVTGEAGLLVDPYSIDQIEQAIRVLIADKRLRYKYSKKGIIQAKKFSWDKMAKAVLKTFENISSKD